MEAVGRLVGGVAHDFNNLLAVILGESALLRDTLTPGHPGLQDLQEIRIAGERAADLTRQLLTFSRQQPVASRVVELNEAVCQMERMLRRLLGEDIRLEVWPAESPTPVRTDPGQLEQVLLNLAVNSRDAMPHGGRLSIGVEQVELDRQYLERHAIACGAGRYARITVTDTGCGMNEETRSRIFEPFFTTKAPGQGTGLGLSTVYGIVKQNAGFVWVYSEIGIGTSFKVYLPLTTPRIEDTVALPEPELPILGTETILVAEDDPGVRSFIVRALERQGYTVLAGSDLEALAIAAATSAPIDLLLTDVVMPDLRGPDLARHLVEQRPDLKVLFMSGYPGHATDQLQLPATVSYIQKPYTPALLGRLVRQVLDRSPAAT
jgi:CheY-like chemotaxis protein